MMLATPVRLIPLNKKLIALILVVGMVGMAGAAPPPVGQLGVGPTCDDAEDGDISVRAFKEAARRFEFEIWDKGENSGERLLRRCFHYNGISGYLLEAVGLKTGTANASLYEFKDELE
ncbi:hypothetical protein BJ138DRAFT_1183690 [Hygrophoropsis aurantiaca]|uniref:Uncharacterized protein n=1 Tax=Hygrophoropsis aurantiaca TaxID=72124 RepID=A0ACB7ZYB3_9AGAM|nr:hypothetical protein BJ138DRAFT_1183690 [Hygrophoropsis aurantiaca]